MGAKESPITSELSSELTNSVDLPPELRKDLGSAAANSCPFLEATVSPPVQKNAQTDDRVKGKRRRRRKLGVDYGVFNNSSDDGSDHEKPVKVPGKWLPKRACRPLIDEAPVFHPSEEEFKDTIGYITSIRQRAEQYGICRIVPPPSWKPSCILKAKTIWDCASFTTRLQEVDKLQNRGPVRKRSHGKRRRKKRLRFGMTRRRNNNNASEANDGAASDNDEKFGFQPGPDFTLEAFRKYANEFKEEYFGINDVNGNLAKRWQPSVEEIEGEYWRIVEKTTKEVEVAYGADLETSNFSSGFPKASKSNDVSDPYVLSGWNLNNLPRLPGSVIAFESADISGVSVPWLYIAMCFSSFCWHVEDHHLYSLNYMHFGDPKVWYGVPGSDAVKLEDTMRKHLPELFEEQPDLLHGLVTQLSPSVLKSEGVPVYRAIQRSGEFVLTFPRAYHAGFNCGFNCAEAVNVAPVDWLENGQYAVELYSEQCRKTSVSHDKLLLGAAGGAVRALWESSFLAKSNLDNVRWQKLCGKEGVLTQAIKARVAMEQKRRESFCSSSQKRKMDISFDLTNERECFLCFYDLHLSAAGCECSLDRFACLTHSNQLCSCEPSKRFNLFRYSMEELITLVEALEGNSSAVQSWGLNNLGLVLPSNVALLTRVGDSMPSHPSVDLNTNIDNSPACCEGSSEIIESHKTGSDITAANCQSPVASSPGCVKSQCGTVSNDEVHSVIEKGEGCQYPKVGSKRSPSPETDIIVSDDTSSKRGRGNPDQSTEHSWTESKARCMEKPDMNDSAKTEMSEIKEDPDSSSQVLKKVQSSHSLDAIVNGSGMHKSGLEWRPTSLSENLSRSSPKCSSLVPVNNSSELDLHKEISDTNSIEASCSKDTEHIRKPSVKLFGVVLQQSQPSLLASLNGQGKEDIDVVPCKSSEVEHVSPKTETYYGRSRNCVEPLDFGTVMSGKRWCSKKAIFPKGFRSRVRYLSVLDPTTTCNYISEVIDGGLLGPIFKVTVEEYQKMVITDVSATQCWDVLRESLNQEILKHRMMGMQGLPDLQPPGSIDGLEMFGFLSPPILQVIEDLDPHHCCSEYWLNKSIAHLMPKGVDMKITPTFSSRV